MDMTNTEAIAKLKQIQYQIDDVRYQVEPYVELLTEYDLVDAVARISYAIEALANRAEMV